jgi:hypothetical protein
MLIVGIGVALLLGTMVAAQAAPPLVNPVTIPLPLGSTAHLTPVDQNGQPIPIGQCSLTSLPATIATATKDVTGFVLTSVASGTAVGVRVDCTDGTTHVLSPTFSVTVPNPPYAVTAVGTVP